jgi:hypothetical protein
MRTPRSVSLSLLLLGVTFASTACGSEGSECHVSEDCSGALECAGPSEPQVCGIPANEQCTADADCGADDRCHAIADPCSPDGVGSECRPQCSEGGCGEGFRCAASSACEAIPCDEDFACAGFEICDPSVAKTGPVHARAHGCVASICSDDSECPSDGACVNGVCQEGPGTCVEPQAVP